MVNWLKRTLYFTVCGYFRFFAGFRLRRWQPRVIVVTASSGKTTCLHMIEAQIGQAARYSHHANSAIGIPFDILGLHRETLMPYEWFKLLLLAPFMAFKNPPPEKLYVVEADCDRPGEGKFLADFLKPEVTIWLNSTITHAMNFDRLVQAGRFNTVVEAIAFEFGYFIEKTSKLAVVNGNSDTINSQLYRCQAQIIKVSKPELSGFYNVTGTQTKFSLKNATYSFNGMLPPDAYYALLSTLELLKYLKVSPDPDFSGFTMPPGRGRIFKGIKNITIFDSCYNANLDSVKNIIETYSKYPAKVKWLVLGDMLELGIAEKSQHQKLASLVNSLSLKSVVLLGPRVKKYTYPLLVKLLPKSTRLEVFTDPSEVLTCLKQNIKGGETILFKGARFLEGVVENLLLDKADARYLSRREKVWNIRRKKWGF